MNYAIALGLSLVVAVGCSADRRSTGLDLRGPLAMLVERKPGSLGECELRHREYVRPFWRAPYRQCRDTLIDGSSWLEVDADSVVTEASREWSVAIGGEQAAWDREARQLTTAFGQPVWDSLAPSRTDAADIQVAHLRSYCAAWRGPYSVEAALRLTPTSDVSPAPGTSWRLVRNARNGPLADAIACRPVDTRAR